MNVIAAESSGAGLNLLLLLAVPVIFYFLLIRPQSKRRKEQLEMQNRLEPGARVLTTSGMYAEVVEVEDDGIVLELAPDVEVKFVKQAIMQVLKDDDIEDEAEDVDEDEDDLDEAGEPAVDLSKDEDAADETDADKPARPATEKSSKS